MVPPLASLQDDWKDPDKVQDTAEKVLDADGTPVPPFFLPLLTDYMRQWPGDTNFIVEFAEKGKPSRGGNGFGTITCMEDYCWKDIILDADPDRPNGGRDDGFGSFYNYTLHCQDESHIKGRNERLRKAGIAIPGQAQETAAVSGGGSYRARQAGPSSSSAGYLAPVSPSLPSPLSSRNANLPESKPPVTAKGKGRAIPHGLSSEPIYISSDEDSPPPVLKRKLPAFMDSDSDDVEFLDADRVPTEMRKVTNRDKPYEISDDDDDGPSLLSHLAQVPAALSEAKRIKTEQDRASQSVAWAKLLRPAASPPRSLSQRSNHIKSPQPPSLASSSQDKPVLPAEKPFPAAVNNKYTVTPIVLPRHFYEPSTWWANELAHAQNHRSRLKRFPETEYVARDRPRVNQLMHNYSIQFSAECGRAEQRLMLDLYRRHSGVKTYGQVLMNRLVSLSKSLSKGSYYDCPDINILRLGGKELEELWERILPTPAQAARGELPGPSTSDIGPVAGPKPPSYSELLSRHFPTKPMPGGFPGTSAGPSGLTGTSAGQFGSTGTSTGQYGFPAIGAGAGYPAISAGPSGFPGTSAGPSAYGDHDYGYELDRPATSEGIATLFRTALDDFHEDTDVDTALKGLDLTKLEDKIDGLNVQLMPHQVQGVHWMLQQERKTSNQGGILGDMMGLGKTVQAIATMVKYPSQDRTIKATLIVLPLPLIQQWKAEIESKSNLTVYVYHGPNRTKSLNQLKNVDCVLTTYSIVAMEGSDLIEKPKKKKRTQDWISDDEADAKPTIKKKGPLFKMAWYRIVLDEAAVIRNKSTKASKCILELVGDIRWCLTGTLIYNSLNDIYPYLRFIGIIDWTDFRNQISAIATKKPRLASRRAQAILRKVMLRRTKDSELGGKKILQLPPKTVDMIEMDFDEEERTIYEAIETAARVKVNKWYKAGTLLKQYHIVLVMLTRLRQFCCHPWLLRASEEYRNSHAEGIVELDDGEDGVQEGAIKEYTDEEEVARAIKDMGQDWVDKVKRKLEQRYQTMVGEQQGDEDDFSCAVCFEPFTNEKITACQHSFCATCIEGILSSAPRDAIVADERVRQSRPCPLCRNEIVCEQLYRATVFFKPAGLEDEAEDIKPLISLKGKGRSKNTDEKDAKDIKPDVKGKGKAKAEPSDETDGPTELEDVDIEDVLPSTKMKKIGDLLDLWNDVDPTQKTLIFCSFVEMLELMSVYLRKRGIEHVLYTGKMKMDERDAVIQQFQGSGDETPQVMLISLKCGGVGLNLTAANNVIGLDLAWSPASEAQAVDRAHRIGQTRPVTVKRLVIRNSVEQRILALQERKQMLADGAMGEGNGGRLGRLSAGELLALFGNSSSDDE